MSDERISRIDQVKIYTVRYLKMFINENGWKVLVFGAIISLIISWVVGDNMFVLNYDTESGAFSIVSAAIWIGIFNSIQTVCKERAIIKREHRTGLHISSYIVSHMICQMMICLLQAVIMLLLCNFFMDFPKERVVFSNVYFDIFITFFLIIYSSDALGIAVSSFVKTPNTAMTVMPFVLILQLVMSGVLFTLEGSAAKVANITISKWGMESLGTIANINNLPINSDGIMSKAREAYEYTKAHVLSSWGILAFFICIYVIFSIGCLEFIDRDKR